MNKKNDFFNFSIYINIAGALLFLGVIAYLAIFTRYMSDDYCETIMVKASSPVTAVINRYAEGKWRAANRYSNLFFVGVVEFFGSHNIQFVPIVMLLLWVLGLTRLWQEIQKTAGFRMDVSVTVLLAVWLAFFSAFEAPSRYQVFYWRSSMATHFAPLVFLNFLIASLLSRIRSARGEHIPVWTSALFAFAAFVIAGFSEPPNTVMIVSSGLCLFYVFFFVRGDTRRPALNLLASLFTGAVLALVVMAVSPAVARVSEGSPSFLEWVYRTTQYTYLFLINVFKSLPIPSLLSFAMPALLHYIIYRRNEDQSFALDRRKFLYMMLAAPLILLLLIAAGFSPSAYGQSYPVERARFFAHFLMTATLMFEGALLGIWLSQIKAPFVGSRYAENLVVVMLLICAFYPFRAGWQTLQQNYPVYLVRAKEWDERQVLILQLKAQGETDLTVPQFDGVEGTKELDTYATHWVNKCAAKFYGVKSIRAIPQQ